MLMVLIFLGPVVTLVTALVLKGSQDDATVGKILSGWGLLVCGILLWEFGDYLRDLQYFFRGEGISIFLTVMGAIAFASGMVMVPWGICQKLAQLEQKVSKLSDRVPEQAPKAAATAWSDKKEPAWKQVGEKAEQS